MTSSAISIPVNPLRCHRNLSDLASVSTARTNLSVLSAAETNAAISAAIASIDLSSKLNASAVSAFGLTLIDDADAAAARTTLSVSPTSEVLLKADNLSGLASVSTARTNLGLGTGDSPTFTGLNLSSRLSTTGDILVAESGKSPFVLGGGLSGTNGRARLCYASNSDGELSLQAIALSSSSNLGNSRGDTFLRSDAANTAAQRNSTNGQKSRIYKTYTSSTSGEWLEFDAADNASNFDIAACVGSLGGTARGIRIGSKNAAGTFASWLSIATNGRVGVGKDPLYSLDVNGGIVTSGAQSYLGLTRRDTSALVWQFYSPTGDLLLYDQTADRFTFKVGGKFGVGVNPTALIHTKAGTATAGSAPIKLTAGTNLTTPEDGAIEFDGTNLYITISGTRRTIQVV